ncbi:MAG: GntR family transcriptional regulator [Pseudomonadota bacterium]
MDDVGEISDSSRLEPPLYDRIVRVICAEIASGSVAEGERLMESRLAARFGVSRAPARQALAELEASGLVVHAAPPSRGFVVADNAKDLARGLVDGPVDRLSFEVTPIWQRIYGSVEEAITQRIGFGSWRVVETALGQHYGVSRTVAREVLARLQSAGLVLNEGKRWIALEMTAERVRELYALRALLEPAALESAAARVAPERISAMISDLDKAIRSQVTAETLDRLERDLHFTLLGRCTNTILKRTMVQHQSLLLAHTFFYRLTAQMYPVEPFLPEHLGVLEHLAAGRVPAAQEALRQHLEASSARAVERIAEVRGVVRNQPISYLERLSDA